MFKSAQDYITLIITRDFVHSAVISVNNKAAEVKLFSEVLLEEGIIEDGVVYNSEGLTEAVTECISHLGLKGSKLKVWLAIPDNKVLVSNSHSIDKLEKKFDVSLDELSIIKSDNGLTGIKKDNLNTYITAVENAGYDVQSVFPLASCVQGTIKNYISGNTIVLYPFEGNKVKFFIANEKGVILNSIMGHNILEKSNDLEKGLKEIETYSTSQQIVDQVNKVVAIFDADNDNIAELIHNYEFEYIEKDQDEIDNLPFLVIKGMIKKVNAQAKGFTIDDVDLKKSSSKINIVAADSPSPVKNNAMKLGIIATVLTLLVFVLIGVLVMALFNSKKDPQTANTTTKVPSVTTTPTATIVKTATPTLTPTATPTPEPLQLDKYSVNVQNGNGIKGDSEKVKQILLAKGFKNVISSNAGSFDYAYTVISVKAGAEAAGDNIISILKDTYQKPTRSAAPSTQTSDIVVILGPKI